ALVCTARSPRCAQCPLAGNGCAWFAAGRPAPEPDTRRRQAFEGTDRQMRGLIMALLRREGAASQDQLMALDREDPDRVRRSLRTLAADGLAVQDGAGLSLPCCPPLTAAAAAARHDCSRGRRPGLSSGYRAV